MMKFRNSSKSSRSFESASTPSTGTSSRSGAAKKNSRSRNPMARLFKDKTSSKSKNAMKFLQQPGELEFSGKGSLDSITSIISAITLDEGLAPVPEAEAEFKFGNDCADSKPRRPARRFS